MGPWSLYNVPGGVIHDRVQQDGRRMRCGYVLITGTDVWRTVFRCDEDGGKEIYVMVVWKRKWSFGMEVMVVADAMEVRQVIDMVID